VFKSVQQKPVAHTIREQLLHLIQCRELAPADKLPAEKDLSEQLGVSRPTLREALHMLVGEGLLEIRRGRGVFVRELSSASAIHAGVVSLLLMSEELYEIQQVRHILEPEIAARMAQHSSEADLEELQRILDTIEQRIIVGAPIFDLAWAFHRRIAQAAGNSAMAKIVDVVYEMIKTAEQPLYDQHFDPLRELDEHRELLRVLKTRDPQRAHAAMKAHLQYVDGLLQQALETEEKVHRQPANSPPG